MSDLFNRANQIELKDIYDILSEFNVVIKRKKEPELFPLETGIEGEAYSFTIPFLGEGEIGLDNAGDISCLFEIRTINSILNDSTTRLSIYDIYKIILLVNDYDFSGQQYQSSLYISGLFYEDEGEPKINFKSRLPTQHGISHLAVKSFISEFLYSCRDYKNRFNSNAKIVEYYL